MSLSALAVVTVIFHFCRISLFAFVRVFTRPIIVVRVLDMTLIKATYLLTYLLESPGIFVQFASN